MVHQGFERIRDFLYLSLVCTFFENVRGLLGVSSYISSNILPNPFIRVHLGIVKIPPGSFLSLES